MPCIRTIEQSNPVVRWLKCHDNWSRLRWFEDVHRHRFVYANSPMFVRKSPMHAPIHVHFHVDIVQFWIDHHDDVSHLDRKGRLTFDLWPCQLHELHRQMQHELLAHWVQLSLYFWKNTHTDLEWIENRTEWIEHLYLTVTRAAALTRPKLLRNVHSYRPASSAVIFLMNRLPLTPMRWFIFCAIDRPSFLHWI